MTPEISPEKTWSYEMQVDYIGVEDLPLFRTYMSLNRNYMVIFQTNVDCADDFLAQNQMKQVKICGL